jgi:hypothetical protein
MRLFGGTGAGGPVPIRGLAFLLLAAACSKPVLYLPPPPEAGIATSIVIIGIADGRPPLFGHYDTKLELEADPDANYVLYALAFGCGEEFVADPPYPKPYAIHSLTLPEDQWLVPSDLTALSGIVDTAPVCPIYDGRLVPIPGTENSESRATIAAIDSGVLLAAEEGTFVVRSDGTVESVAELGGQVWTGAATMPSGEVGLVAPGRAVRWSPTRHQVIELPPMLRDPADAVLAADSIGFYATTRTSSGTTQIERFDGTTWRRIRDCNRSHYTTSPKPSVTVGDRDALIVFPSEIRSEAMPRLEAGALAAIDEFGCDLAGTPTQRIGAGTLSEVGRVFGALNDRDFDAGAWSVLFIERTEANWERIELPLDPDAAPRGSLSAASPRARGFSFGTFFGWIGEWFDEAFCFLDDRPPNLPIEIEPLETGFVVLSKGRYDPTGTFSCEHRGECLPLQVTFVERTELPTAECSLRPE